jgi:hypothetical protein
MILRPRALAALLAGGAALTVASCNDFKSTSPSEPDDAGGSPDGSSSPGDQDGAASKDAASSRDGSASGETGPGPRGALPSGYCCTSDDECRYRNCATIHGSKMCADACEGSGTSSCDGNLPGFTCEGSSPSAGGQCEPPAAATCVPASQFVHGTKKLGACCTALHTGEAGNECEGGHCSSFGAVNNPYICVNACASAADCPGNFKCTNTGSGYAICLMLADPYTCDK